MYEQAADISHEIDKRYLYDCVIQPRLLAFENDTKDSCVQAIRKYFEEEAKLFSEFIRIEELYILADGKRKTTLIELILSISLRKKEKKDIFSGCAESMRQVIINEPIYCWLKTLRFYMEKERRTV